MNRAAIDAYIAQLPFTDVFTSLPVELQDKIIFGASEMLSRRYAAAVITEQIIALQSVFMAEGEKEEFAKFKRQGVKQFSLDTMSFSFDLTHVSPEVIAIIGEPQIIKAEEVSALPAFFGRLG